MRTRMLALALGLLALRFIPALPAGRELLAIALLGGLLLFWPAPYRYSRPGRALGVALLGFTWACVSAGAALEDRLAPALDGQIVWLQGRVVGLPAQGREGVRFQLQDATSRRGQLPTLLRLSWRQGPALQAGETWRLAVKLKRPRGLVNPQGFDYEAWLLAQRIGAQGSVKQGTRLQASSGLVAWRDQLRQRLLAVDAFGRQGGLAALVLGDDSGLSSADWRVLQDTGTVHLMVISGQHIGLLAGLLYGLVAGLARLGLWPQRLPWLPSACALAAVGALGYGLLAGFQVPVQRACLMVALVLIWRLRFRHLGVWLPLLVALDLVLLAEPLASLQAGFWLSFGAVLVLIWGFAGRLGAWPWWHTLGRMQWLMTIGLLPLMLGLGLPLSLSGPLANLLAEPWVSLAVVPPALLGTLTIAVPWLGAGLLQLAGGSLELLFRLLSMLAAWQPAWLASQVPVWAWLLGALGAALLLAPAGVPGRMLGLAMLLPLLFPPLAEVPDGQAQVWQLDIGQGLSVLVRTRHHAMLYDTGPRSADFDSGERVVVPSLRGLGLRQLDLLLISHADNDHAGGALAVQRGLAVAQVLSGEPGELPAALAAQPCRNGAQWQWDGVRFETWRWAKAADGNQASCVLWVEAGGERLLLTGDIDAAAEAAWVKANPTRQAEWLQAPHHGSRSASSMTLLQALAPQAVLVSRGAHNAFGHPHPQVMARYRALGLKVYDSVEQGAVRIRLGARTTADGLRKEPRFWREK
ncbi:competence protein ComEC [Pseudomonas sp. TE3786]